MNEGKEMKLKVSKMWFSFNGLALDASQPVESED
jgi:hypothetical protein